MTLKMKLTASISAFVLIIGLMLMGIMAVNQATVNMGGSINFTATDVYARVTGKIENAQGEYADKELPPLEFSAENGTPDQSGWSGLNLLFDDDATPIVITVTVENLARDRQLTASLTDNTAINENLVKDLKQDGVTYTSGTTKDLDASTGNDTSTTTYVVTFSIADHNKSLPQMDFEFDIDLMDEGYEPPVLEGFVFDNGVLTAYNGTATDVVIPSSYSILDNAVVVDKTLEFSSFEDLEDYAMTNYDTFNSMTNFTVTIDDSQYGPYDTFDEFVNENEVFELMYTATSIIFKYQEESKYIEGNDYAVTSIGESAFSGKSLNSLTVPDSIQDIGARAFADSTIITINFNANIENSTSLFSGTTVDVLNIGANVINIPDYFLTPDYHNYHYVKKVYFMPNSRIETIGASAFSGLSGSSGLVEVDLSNCTNLTSIGGGLFYNCPRLTSIALPPNLASIENQAFYECYNLTSITLPSSLTSIGQYAFRSCGFTNIDISNCTRLTSIYFDAFADCNKLASVTINQYAFEHAYECGDLLDSISSGETVLVPANLIDDLGLTSSYLDGSSFTRSETANEDGYYVYTRN